MCDLIDEWIILVENCNYSVDFQWNPINNQLESRYIQAPTLCIHELYKISHFAGRSLMV